MNGCLTTPQHEKQIGYWVSEKGERMKWLLNVTKAVIGAYMCADTMTYTLCIQ